MVQCHSGSLPVTSDFMRRTNKTHVHTDPYRIAYSYPGITISDMELAELINEYIFTKFYIQRIVEKQLRDIRKFPLCRNWNFGHTRLIRFANT